MNNDAALERLLRALADATRRQLLDRLRDSPGLTLGELAAGVTVTRQALAKHLATLEAAGLVVPVWQGREKRHYLDPEPLRALPARWIGEREHGQAVAALQQALQPPTPARASAAGGLAAPRPVADPLVERLQSPAPTDLAGARRYLQGTADAVRGVIEQLPATAGYRRPAAGGFSLAEHLWHLADLDELGWAPRFERLWAETRPRLPGVDGDRLARERDYQHRPWRGAARRFIAQRRRALRALGRFDDAALERRCHFAGQPTTARDVLAAWLAHDAEHRSEMAALWPLEREIDR